MEMVAYGIPCWQHVETGMATRLSTMVKSRYFSQKRRKYLSRWVPNPERMKSSLSRGERCGEGYRMLVEGLWQKAKRQSLSDLVGFDRG